MLAIEDATWGHGAGGRTRIIELLNADNELVALTVRLPDCLVLALVADISLVLGQ